VGETGAAAPQWRRSHHSGSTGGQCVEVAAAGDGLVRIRDSKNPGGPEIIVSATCWRRCLPRLGAAAGTPGDDLLAVLEGGWVFLRHARQPGGPVLRFTPGEWDVFLRGARDGDFDLTADGKLCPAAPSAGRLRELSAATA
jgi:hypothetical protein